MTLNPDEVFALYLAVFLAVIFGAWFIDSRRRRRWERGDRRLFLCSICGADIAAPGPSLKLRCPACGALHDRLELQAKDSAKATAAQTNNGSEPATEVEEVKEKN